MHHSGYATRVAAALFTAALLGAAIAWPKAGSKLVEGAADFAAKADGAPMAARACAIGEPALAGPFAPVADVLSVSPLGGVTAPGETLPAPYIRINTRSGEKAFERIETTALAPARADIVAIERHVERDPYGRAEGLSWTVHFRSCENISFYYDRIDDIDVGLLERAGGLRAFSEFGSPDHMALETRVRVKTGDVIGTSDGFDVGLHDLGAKPATLARPERYRTNSFARAAVFDASPSLMALITPETTKARCALDYLPKEQQDAWAAKLGDAWGIRKAKGDNTCRTALVDTPDAAQGAWFTDAAHNAATTKVSAIALSSDAIDPDRLIFALHGRLPSLKPAMIASASGKPGRAAPTGAVEDFLSFEKGEGRINTPFADVTDYEMHCYQRLRTNFIGPLINGVVLLQRQQSSDNGGPDILKIEARGDVTSCVDLDEPWSFTGNETTFYR
ncbi:hypothetical protein PUV54_07990 [Hyphococcus flavus]|uniref:Uncharacterized protein n=1 Tax=Hyphococcus flavus TaxID=1866326 RepID=A0AAE9ZEF8_9PROT|nr:hypothetical protein [Hyphococcus flavus]WDI33136.1 hypothetical protein PUV54_07990 [Hyphococcus flavus]